MILPDGTTDAGRSTSAQSVSARATCPRQPRRIAIACFGSPGELTVQAGGFQPLLKVQWRERQPVCDYVASIEQDVCAVGFEYNRIVGGRWPTFAKNELARWKITALGVMINCVVLTILRTMAIKGAQYFANTDDDRKNFNACLISKNWIRAIDAGCITGIALLCLKQFLPPSAYLPLEVVVAIGLLSNYLMDSTVYDWVNNGAQPDPSKLFLVADVVDGLRAKADNPQQKRLERLVEKAPPPPPAPLKAEEPLPLTKIIPQEPAVIPESPLELAQKKKAAGLENHNRKLFHEILNLHEQAEQLASLRKSNRQLRRQVQDLIGEKDLLIEFARRLGSETEVKEKPSALPKPVSPHKQTPRKALAIGNLAQSTPESVKTWSPTYTQHLQRVLAEHKKEVKNLNAKLEELERLREANDDLSRQIKTLKIEIQTLKKIIAPLQDEAQKQERKNQSVQREIETFTEINDEN